MSLDSAPYLILSFVLGIALCYALLRGRFRSSLATFEEQLRQMGQDLTAERERRAALEGELRQLATLREELRVRSEQIVELQERLNNKIAECSVAEEKSRRIPNLEQTLKQADERLHGMHEENTKLREHIRELSTTLDKERESAAKQLALYEQAEKKLSDAFDVLSRKALQHNNQSFLDLARESLQKFQESAKGDLEKRQQAIDELVTPLRTKIKDFEQKVDEVYRTEAAERNSLRGEIKSLVELNQQISKEASNLVLALKGDTKKQGNWGELICEKVLEFSGLRKGIEYKIQESIEDDDGRRKQPDVIVYLPENKHIIIDSKVSLVAYDRYISAQTDGEHDLALIEHIASVKRHVKELSDKEYSSLPLLDSPDFTLLFMPIESSFGLAIQADNELFTYAWDRKIIIVSPSTLLATLRTISSIWKQERQTKNALEIADRAGKMYDKFVGFIEDLIIVGKRMGEAKSGYDDAMKKLSSGPGNLVRQSEQLKEMGAKATKQLPLQLLDRSIDVQPVETVAAGPEEDRLL